MTSLVPSRRYLVLEGYLASSLLALAASTTLAGNPLIPDMGVSDPHMTVYGGRAYLFAGHDPTLADWWVWSSADLVNWKQESVLRPEATFIGKPYPGGCWASFGTFKNGCWCWYYSAGGDQIGVVTASSPAGPWKEALGKPLIPRGLTPTDERDPDIFIEDDGTTYMVYGTFNYYLVRLNEDMVSLAEKPRHLQIDRQFGPAGAGRTDDKPSLHKRGGVYYLSWSSFYAVSRSLYGPYTYRGSVITPEVISPEFRKGDLWADRHGNFFTWNNQWYFLCHDLTRPGGHGRQACLSYVHYRDNGDMAPIRLDPIGVGQCDATQGRIEAEDYFKAVGAEPREHPMGGFEMRGLRDGSYLVYPKVMNMRQNHVIAFNLSCDNPAGGTIEVRQGGPRGKLLGSCQIPKDIKKWDSYRTVLCPLQNEAGTNDLCVVFKGGTEEMARLDWFEFL
jgi:arabinoxylan arabinofuranohydrolase